jgi:hypothetical protein
MSCQTTEKTVRRTLRVPVSADRSFTAFTEEMSAWWPIENTFASVAFSQPETFETVIVEPREGGRWFERSIDGKETDWGRVVVFDPLRRLVLTWQITPQGTPEPDPSKASEVELRFVPEGPSTTRVELEHREFERHGEAGAVTWREAMESAGGWSKFLDRYAAAV